MRIHRATWLAVAMVFTVGSPSFGMGIEVVNNDRFNLNIGGRIQEVAYMEVLEEDPVQSKDDTRLYLFLRQARLNMNGRVDDVKFNMEWVGGGEDINGSNAGLTLLDFSFDVPFFKADSTWLKVGQFKVPYGREAIAHEGMLQFVEPSVDFIGFNLGRDVGAALHTYHGAFAGTLGVFTGGARDVPLRFLPEHLGVPMMVLRMGLNDGLDKDIFTVSQNDLMPQRVTKATYINAMYMKDTRIGHSTVLNSRTSEKSLLLNANWNPLLAQTPYDRATFRQAGWDAAIRGPMGENKGWSAEAEINYADFASRHGGLRILGYRAQTAILIKKFEAAVRWSMLVPDNKFRKTTTRITPSGTPIQEVGPAFSYYIKGHDHKIVLDAPLLIDVPVFIENGTGTYVSVRQPDQSSVIVPATGRVTRQNVALIRLMYQLAF